MTKSKEDRYREYITRLRAAAYATSKAAAAVKNGVASLEINELDYVLSVPPDSAVWCLGCGMEVRRCAMYQRGDRYVMASKKCCPDCSHGSPEPSDVEVKR